MAIAIRANPAITIIRIIMLRIAAVAGIAVTALRIGFLGRILIHRDRVVPCPLLI
jgi:hypothetical protein